MSRIMDDTGISYTQAGQMLTIVTLMMGVFLLCGSWILGRVGAVRGMTIGCLCLAVDGFCSCFGGNYILIMIGKIFCGCGYGLTMCSSVALIAATFPTEQLGLINSLNSCITSLSISLAYQFIVPIYEQLGSWQAETAMWGNISIGAAILFIVWRRCAKGISARASSTGQNTNSIRLAWRFPLVRRMIFIVGGTLLLYSSLTAYFPNYLHTDLHFSLDTASSMAGAISISGIIGSLLIGICRPLLNYAKQTICVLLLLMAAGFAGMLFFHQYALLMIAICCFGASYFALSTFCSTTTMRQPHMTPLVASAATSLMSACGSLLAIIVPQVQEALSGAFGLKAAIAALGILFIPAYIGAVALPKPAAKEKQIPSSAPEK